MAQGTVNAPWIHYLHNGKCYPYTIFEDNGDDTYDGWWCKPGLLGALDQTIANGVSFDTIDGETFMAEGTNHTLHTGGTCCT